MANRSTTGQTGEQAAANHLKRKGYTIITTNWHGQYGEIDIVAKDPTNDDLVFVEVKTRKYRKLETAFAAITARKREKMTHVAYEYLHMQALPDDTAWPIDVIGVTLDSNDAAQIKHVENALDW